MAIERTPDMSYAVWPFHDEDDMPDSAVQDDLSTYIDAVLTYQYAAEEWYIRRNYAIYLDNPQRPLVPDIAVFLGVTVRDIHQFPSWQIAPPERPAPRVVFEIASTSTWRLDSLKVPVYQRWGIDEVYIYDPGIPRVWTTGGPRLRGWQRNNAGVLVEQPLDERGHLWSPALTSYLVSDGDHLRFAEKDGTVRLTGTEAGRLGRLRAEARADAARAAEEQAEARVQQATLQMQQAEDRAVAERTAREAEQRAKEAAWAKLRALGIDPATPA